MIYKENIEHKIVLQIKNIKTTSIIIAKIMLTFNS